MAKIFHPSERPLLKNRIYVGPMPRAHRAGGEKPLEGARARACSRCGKRFAPTIKRRMLCHDCYKGASSSLDDP